MQFTSALGMGVLLIALQRHGGSLESGMRDLGFYVVGIFVITSLAL